MRFSNARFCRSLSLTLALLGLLTPLVAPASFTSRASGSRAASRAEAVARSAAAPTQAAQMTSAQAQAAYAKLPLQFEANQGQTDAEVDFITRVGGATVFLTRTGTVSVLRLADESGAASGGESLQAGRRGRPEAETRADAPRMAVLRMKLEGANPRPAVSGLDELEGKVNYFIGDDSEKWRTNIPTFGRVRYASVYAGVDMVYYGNGQRQLEYDFEIRPGTDYRQIAFSFEGADKVEVEAASGALLLQVGETTLRQPKPVVYQEVDGERVEIESRYEIKGGGRVGFAVSEYDAARPLIIDPVLAYSTYLGGSGDDNGRGIAVDAAGNAYVTGQTGSTNFPTANAIQATYGGGVTDAFVTKLNAAGSALVYSTYLGGSSGGIAVDSAGNAYVTGLIISTDFPTTANALQATRAAGNDAFIAKLGSFAISGRVIDSGGNGISGVTVTLSGANSAITTTDAGGNFIFLDTTPNGNFTVTPFLAGFTFSPESITISNLNSNQDLLFIGSTPGATPTPSPSPSPTPATFQFSAVSFSAGEGAGSAQIIVTRSGDTAAAATVDYATTDGTANDRGDYATAIGRLSFGAGETAKSFNVFVTDDAYAEGNETVNITLSSPSAGGQVGGSGSVILTIVDNDAAPSAANPIDSTQFFVRQHYVDFLNREPDVAGLAFWINNIESCGANANCRAAKRVDTSAAFFLSIEFQETGFLVHRIYRSAFNRLSRYREFVRDSQAIGRGVVIGQPGAEAQLEANKQAFATEFVTRAEFTAIYGGLSNEQYVDALNANTGGSLSQSERDALVAGLNSMTETRATVLRKVADDADFKAREANPAFVLMQYFGYLRRNPDDAPDTNFDGFNFWLQKLNSFGGDFRKADMVKAFITSSEFRVRFGT